MSEGMGSAVYSVPADFARRLAEEFRGELRIRWSRRRQRWQIEQKVGRGCLPPIRIDEEDDDLIRARDGYWLFLEFLPGDRMACPQCGLTVKVPHCRTAEARCEHCIKKGRDGRYAVAYWPIGEVLLEHIRRCDPRRGGIQRVKADCDEANRKRLAAAERAQQTHNEAATAEAFNQLWGIPTFGYTGQSSRFIHRDKAIR